jgi:adenosylhomocysteinase
MWSDEPIVVEERSIPLATRNHDIKDLKLAAEGALRAEWAGREMPVLKSIRERFAKEKPLKGIRVAGCLHITAETANLVETLRAGGAEVVMCASNPLSTQDDIAAYLVKSGVPTYAIKGEDGETYYKHIMAAIDSKPHVTVDDGADLVAMLHTKRKALLSGVIGGMEETTTGVVRLKALHEKGDLKYPIVAVNDSDTKHMFDNRYGTGQSTIDGILRATNMLLAGKTMVIAGFGWCGKGLASRAKGLGAHTVVCEVDPVRALEAAMEGHQVMKMSEAAPRGDLFVTVTGDVNVIDRAHLKKMKDGAVMANSGHFNAEINVKALEEMSETKRKVRPFVDEYALEDGRRLFLLGEGRLINLAAAEGHPPSVMDMSFANQALAGEWIVDNHAKLKPGVYTLPPEIDREIARLKLKSMGMGLDVLTAEQEKYLASWELGT